MNEILSRLATEIIIGQLNGWEGITKWLKKWMDELRKVGEKLWMDKEIDG